MKQSRVLITGGAGFIGSHLTDTLISNGYKVRIIDNLADQVHGSQGWPDYLHDDVEKVKGDIRDRTLVDQCMEGCSYVIHLAAAVGVGQSMYEVEKYTDVNVRGTSILLEAIASKSDTIDKLIVASSMSVYGEGEYKDANGEEARPSPRSRAQLENQIWELKNSRGELKPVPTSESKRLQPDSVYAITKRDQEELCLCVGRAYDIPTVAMRMFNVYGTRQSLSNPYTGVVAIFGSQVARGKRPTVYEDGKQMRDFVHVKDVANAYLEVIQNRRLRDEVYNIGSGNPISIKEVAETIINKMGKNISPEITKQYRYGDVRHCFADISKIKSSSDWEPAYSFEENIEELVDWLNAADSVDPRGNPDDELSDKGLLK